MPTPDLKLETGIGIEGTFTLRYTSTDAKADVAEYRSALAENGFTFTTDFDHLDDPAAVGNVGFVATAPSGPSTYRPSVRTPPAAATTWRSSSRQCDPTSDQRRSKSSDDLGPHPRGGVEEAGDDAAGRDQFVADGLDLARQVHARARARDPRAGRRVLGPMIGAVMPGWSLTKHTASWAGS